MNTESFSTKIIWKRILVVLLVLLAVQSIGFNTFAASAAPSRYLPTGGYTQALTCGSAPTPTPAYCNIQIVLLIDDSGSMRTNDRQFSRNEGAKNLVDILLRQHYLTALEWQADNPQLRLPDVQVAVIHFSTKVIEDSGWIKINPKDWENQQAALSAFIDRNRQYRNDSTWYTHFQEPFEKAAELLRSTAGQTAVGDCTHRSILLFTDGTPEDRGGILQGKALDTEMQSVQASAQGLSDLDVRIYVTGFKVSPRYWLGVKDHWSRIVALAPVPQDAALSRAVLLEGEDSVLQLASRMEEITASLIDVQRFALNPDPQDKKSYSIEIPKHIQTLRLTHYNLDPLTKLVITDPAGVEIKPDGEKVVLSGTDKSIEVWQLSGPLAGRYKVQVSKPGGIITALLTYQNLSVAEFSTIPVELQVGKESKFQFKLVDESGSVLLPGDDPAYTLELDVSAIQEAQETVLTWTQDGDNYTFSWTPKSYGESQFKVVANLVDAKGEVLLNCSGIGMTSIVATPTPTPTPSPTPTPTPPPPTPPPPTPACDGCPLPQACLDCEGLWSIWFWPLAIILVLLLIILLVLKFRSNETKKNDREEKQEISRTANWQLLFWPLLILLILLVLTRLFKWWCIIPPWLFLALILVWMITLLLLRYIPDDKPARRRPWWWLVILLLLLILIWYFFLCKIWICLLWLLLIVLVLIWLILWWRQRPNPSPEPGPQPEPIIIPPPSPASPDDLKIIEGIGEKVADFLNEKGITTFKQLAESDIDQLNAWLDERGWKYMDPKTWPRQAELADKSKKSGKKEDWDKFYEYTAWVKDGIAPDEYNKPEKDRKPPE